MRYEVKPSKIVKGEYGVFAAETIPAGSFVGNMTGMELKKKDVVDDTHVLWIGDDIPLLITDELRYVNHSKTPNCVVEGLLLWSLRRINKGSELSWDYGANFEKYLTTAIS